MKNIRLPALLVCFYALSFPPSSRAAEFSCPAGATDCLITAIDAANDNLAPANTITLGVGTYTLTKPFPNRVHDNSAGTGPTGLPTISSALTIRGGGSGRTIIQRDFQSNDLLRILDIGESGELTLSGLSIENGLALDGGGIFSRSSRAITLSDVSIVDNRASIGGAIRHVGSAVLTVINSCICRNGAVGSGFGGIGGGISIEAGSLTIINSRIIDNHASTSPPLGRAGFGGGISTDASVNIIIGSTIANNSALTGGGISINSSLALTSIHNSTISDNRAFRIPFDLELGGLSGGQGGGIANEGLMVLVNVTVSNNKANPWFDGDTRGLVGGITNFGTANLRNTLIANNVVEDSTRDCSGIPFRSFGHNLDSDGSCGLTDPRDKSGVADPLLDPQLLNNGGTTETHALLLGSPAIDAVPPASCIDLDGNPIHTDQRGVSRPFGSGCDIGAFEFGVYLVNNMVSQDPKKVATSKGPPVRGGPAGTFTISAPFQNGSTRIANPVFEVIVLTGGDLLLNAQGGTEGVGARLIPNVEVLEPGQSFTVDFVIGLQTLNSFAFVVNLLGVPTP